MNLHNKRIGIWGFGAVGKSALSFLHTRCNNITVMSQGQLTPEDQQLLAQCAATFVLQNEKTIHSFLTSHDYIVPSPGIDVRPYAQYQYKWLPEVDIFNDYATNKIVGITGTLGKTTVTTHFSQLLAAHGYHVASGGNIGTPMLDLLQSTPANITVLELSSFQLEHNHFFAPDVAILTNLYPNHLDRHNSFADYLAAKMKLCVYQTEKQHALLPLALLPLLQKHGYMNTLQARIHFFSTQPITQQIHTTLPACSTLYYVEGTEIKKYNKETTKTVIALPHILSGAQCENVLITSAAFDVLEIGTRMPDNVITVQALEHRMEQVKVVNNITFINDSKSTIAHATLAAIHQIEEPVILLLGGLSKGVDRTPFLQQLPNTVRHVICFGAEAQQLAHECTQQHAVSVAITLEDAFDAACKHAQPGMTILLSPGGASFDLFKNYKERGKRFKELVNMIS